MNFALLPESKLQVGNQNISNRGEKVGAACLLHNEVSSDNVQAGPGEHHCEPTCVQVTGSEGPEGHGMGWGGYPRPGFSAKAVTPEP